MEKKMVLSKYLPCEITENILSRLPVESVQRFRCACKTWCTLIDKPCFIQMHLNRNERNNTVKLVLWPSGRKLLLLHLQTPANKVHPKLESLLDYETRLKCDRVIGSCNGLLCIKHIKYREGNNSMTVLNPSAGFYNNFDLNNFSVDTVKTDEWRSADNLYGFVYDEEKKDYQIIVIEFPFDGANVIAYSLGTKLWRTVKVKARFVFNGNTSSGVFLNDALHWVGSRKNGNYRKSVLAFDCKTSCFNKLRLPDYSAYSKEVLIAFRGNLCVICYKVSVIDAWVMEEYGVFESWVKLPTYRLSKSLNYSIEQSIKAYILHLFGVDEERVSHLMNGHIESDTQIFACVESLTSNKLFELSATEKLEYAY